MKTLRRSAPRKQAGKPVSHSRPAPCAALSAFDPALPEDGALILAGVLRDQFNGLLEMIQAIVPGVSPEEMNAAISSAISSAIIYTAQNPSGVQPISAHYMDPVSAGDLNQVKDKVNELIAALYRAP